MIKSNELIFKSLEFGEMTFDLRLFSHTFNLFSFISIRVTLLLCFIFSKIKALKIPIAPPPIIKIFASLIDTLKFFSPNSTA